MASSDTIDSKVKMQPSFLKYLQYGGKFVLTVLGAAYILNGVYHLGKANSLLNEYEQLNQEESFRLHKAFQDDTEREKLGLSDDFSDQIFRIELQDILHSETAGRKDAIAEMVIKEYNRIFNPFYVKITP